MSKKAHAAPTRVRGKVLAFNVSPKGHVEGALVETPDGTVQVNFPKHEAEALARSFRVGAKVDLTAELDTKEFDHAVYTVAKGDGDATVRGKIVRYNYALHGEVNGFHLDDGTFVHLKPEGAKKVRARVGESVIASGMRRSGGEAVVLEAWRVERPSKRGRDASPD